jgi:YVTN family beta-propeller protein
MPSAVRIFILSACIFSAALLVSQAEPREQVGPLPGGAFLLSSGWRLEPVGKQIPLDTFPMASVLSRDGKQLFVLHGGYRPPSIAIIDTVSGQVTSRVPVPDGWLGLARSLAGDRLYVGGGSRAAVFEFAFANGNLTATRTFPVVANEKRGNQDFIGDVALSPDGRMLYAADLYRDSVVAINPQSGMLIQRIKTGRRPYRILFHPDGKSFFVSHWADGTIGHYDASSGASLGVVRIGAHPTDIVWRDGGRSDEVEAGEFNWTARLFVAAASTNSVYAVGVSQSKELRVIENINISMTPRQPLGMTPSALALSADQKRLFVVCSDANAAAVVDVSADHSRVEGFIPAGWYPTAARALSTGTVVVFNGKGLRSHPNPDGPNPSKRPAGVQSEPGIRPGYVGYLQTGTASWIEPFSNEQLEKWTAAALANSPYRDSKLDETTPLPPIQHVIYIVKENRTYDQVLGDMKEGNGDPSLVLFGENVTPNHHKLAREFVLLDNFYVNSDVSADGHNWSTAAIAPDYVQRMWPNQYAGRRKQYDFEAQDPLSAPPAGYLWTNAATAGIGIRNFGYMVNNRPNPQPGASQITGVRDPVLANVTNPNYRGFDLAYPDVERAKVFLAELAEYEKSGNMPRLVLMRLGNDHTSGTSAGAAFPGLAAPGFSPWEAALSSPRRFLPVSYPLRTAESAPRDRLRAVQPLPLRAGRCVRRPG